MQPTLPAFDGWYFLGTFPRGHPDGVGSWLLHNGGDAMLLEVPPGLSTRAVRAGLKAVGCALCRATASHGHGDHLDPNAWRDLKAAYPGTEFVRPRPWRGEAACEDRRTFLSGEPVWSIAAPKHSPSDVVTVFRGVAMIGDIELGTLDAVNREVPRDVRAASMAHLAGFPGRAGYRVHSAISAHANDVRTDVDWAGLFACPP